MIPDFSKLLNAELQRLGVDLPAGRRDSLAQYCGELERWNRRINLTGLSGPELVRRLVAEPVWIAQRLAPSGVLVDIGSGNGSPAIPFHVASELKTTHLVEARVKRAAFLRHLAGTLGLEGIEVHRNRFEEVAGPLGPADWITLQAVALTPRLLRDIGKTSTSTTKVVWITAGVVPILDPVAQMRVPYSETEVFVFQGFGGTLAI